jgi:hypothetical protein
MQALTDQVDARAQRGNPSDLQVMGSLTVGHPTHSPSLRSGERPFGRRQVLIKSEYVSGQKPAISNTTGQRVRKRLSDTLRPLQAK